MHEHDCHRAVGSSASRRRPRRTQQLLLRAFERTPHRREGNCVSMPNRRTAPWPFATRATTPTTSCAATSGMVQQDHLLLLLLLLVTQRQNPPQDRRIGVTRWGREHPHPGGARPSSSETPSRSPDTTGARSWTKPRSCPCSEMAGTVASGRRGGWMERDGLLYQPG